MFAELTTGRRREMMSAVAHYIAGVLPWTSMAEIVDSLCETADWRVGDRVKTLRGSVRGRIIRILENGQVVWQPEGTHNELTALPESLARDG